jgi:hypothetical protein
MTAETTVGTRTGSEAETRAMSVLENDQAAGITFGCGCCGVKHPNQRRPQQG